MPDIIDNDSQIARIVYPIAIIIIVFDLIDFHALTLFGARSHCSISCNVKRQMVIPNIPNTQTKSFFANTKKKQHSQQNIQKPINDSVRCIIISTKCGRAKSLPEPNTHFVPSRSHTSHSRQRRAENMFFVCALIPQLNGAGQGRALHDAFGAHFNSGHAMPPCSVIGASVCVVRVCANSPPVA